MPQEMIKRFTQTYPSGGIHTPPEVRLMLLTLAVGLRADHILETGYDAGVTTEALAFSGAAVVALDNLTEYSEADAIAQERLAGFPNVTLLTEEALDYLKKLPDNKFDMMFIDDWHDYDHVLAEAHEVRRVLAPGGIAAFHDTNSHNLWGVIEEVFSDWQRINLPAMSKQENEDYGIGLVRKPRSP